VGDPIAGRPTGDFILIDARSALDEASSTLEGHQYGVVTREGLPIALITPEDLARAAERGARSLSQPAAGLPPTLLVPVGARASGLIATIAAPVLGLGLRGAIVVDGLDVVGVLPVRSLIRDSPLSVLGSQYALHDAAGLTVGPPGPISGISLLILSCKVCGTPNRRSDFDPVDPGRCDNRNPPHALEI
jgi:hypothetical protein